MRREEKERLMALLPERMPNDILRWALREHREELGGEYLTWKAVRVRECGLELDWGCGGMLIPSVGKPTAPLASRVALGCEPLASMGALGAWVAEVHCTGCGEWFYTAGSGGSFWLETGPDGATYTVEEMPGGDFYDDGDFVYTEVTEGDEAECPRCGEACRVMHSKSLRNGRRKQLMVVSVETIGKYAAVMYWMISREIGTMGTFAEGKPMAAFVIGENGRLAAFRHCRGYGISSTMKITNGWESARSGWDCLDMIYHDWGSIANRKQGAALYPECPALEGTTGEKTGLEAMAKSGFTVCLTDYLRKQKKLPGLENLANQGWCCLVAEAVEAGLPMNGFRWEKKKPREILNMPREHYRKTGDDERKWSRARWRVYHKILALHPGICWETWQEWDDFFGRRLEQAAEVPEGPEKVMRYLKKQKEGGEAVTLLTDTRRMAEQLYRRPLTEEESWPRNLREQHDRLDGILRQRRSAAEDAAYAEGFRQIREQWGHLEWNDGELCILLPMSNSELVREGSVLRHCVGGYGEKHIKGTGSIWFVRHYRRPERSYYTLNINLNTGSEIQLHGYGNERHGDRKQYEHRIPKKVRDFVDRWEAEILAPAIRSRKQEGKSA